MNFATDLVHVYCPYCGENIEIIVDLSVDQQEYVEDCSVCCRPIAMSVAVGAGGAEVTTRSEND